MSKKNRNNTVALANRNKKKFWSGSDTALTVLAIPGIIYFILFAYLPMPGILLAFKNYKPIPGANFFTSLFSSDWSYLDNFEMLFRTPDAGIMIFNTLFYNIIALALGAILPPLLAITLNELRSKRVMKTSQTLMFLPYFLSWVVVSSLVYAFLSPTRGYLNTIIENFGGTGVDWYNNPGPWRFILVALNQWKGLGYSSVIYLSALTSIDSELFEAAVIDGASKFQQIRYITFPLLRRTIAMLLILNIGGIASAGLDLYYQVPRQSLPLYNQYMVVDIYTYNAARGNGNITQASAVGFLQSVIGFILILSTNWVVGKLDEESSLF